MFVLKGNTKCRVKNCKYGDILYLIFMPLLFVKCLSLRWGTEWIRYVLDHFWHLEDQDKEVCSQQFQVQIDGPTEFASHNLFISCRISKSNKSKP